MTDHFNYTISGLHLRSDLELPELPPAPATAKQAKVSLTLGETPSALDKPISRGVLYEAAPSQFLLNMPQVARYWVRGGEQIVVTPQAGSLPEEVRLFLLGTVWAALLHQRGLLVLHASGILTPQGAVLLMGRSSAGKSSLAAAFYQRGYPVLGDDTIAVDVVAGQPVVYPAFAQLRLWPDMLRELGIAPEDTLPLRPKLPKRILPASQGFSPAAQPLRAIYLLGTDLASELKLEKMQGMSRFSTLLNNTFREKFLSGLGVRPQHFQKVSQVAQKTPVALLVRARQGAQFEKLVEAVEKDLVN
jgi:hypothetical protein